MPKWFGGAATNPDFIPDTDQWQIQWKRVCRWYEQCKEIEKKSVTSELTANDHDILITFFQNCYHLQDWIKRSRPSLEPILNDFLENNLEMKICRNISDGYKHKVLDNPKHLDADFNWFREFDYLEKEAYPWKSGIKHYVALSIDNNVKKFDVFELINACHHLWETFIKNNSLKKMNK